MCVSVLLGSFRVPFLCIHPRRCLSGMGSAFLSGISVPPKNASKVEEKTFGMKNKSKSKKIQQYVESIKKEEQRKGPSPAVCRWSRTVDVCVARHAQGSHGATCV